MQHATEYRGAIAKCSALDCTKVLSVSRCLSALLYFSCIPLCAMPVLVAWRPRLILLNRINHEQHWSLDSGQL